MSILIMYMIDHLLRFGKTFCKEFHCIPKERIAPVFPVLYNTIIGDFQVAIFIHNLK